MALGIFRSAPKSLTGYNPKVEAEVEALGLDINEVAEKALSSRPRKSLIEVALILALGTEKK